MSDSETTTILLLGRNGQVGWELERFLPALGTVRAVDRLGADFSRPDTLRDVVRAADPQIIVNAAAYTAVDKAESEPDLAQAVNGTAPGVLAEEAKRIGALLVHYSTDYVFDGTKAGAYVETDVTNPLGVYGRSKLAGEHAIQQVDGSHWIFRTSWVYANRGKNFLLTILRLAREREELRIVDDQFGAPTAARTIAEVTATTIRRWMADRAKAPSGVYHLAAAGRVSWHGFAEEIVADYQGLQPPPKPLTVKRILAIPSAEYPTPAKRPANSSLDCAKLSGAFGVHLPDWRDALHSVLGGCANASP